MTEKLMYSVNETIALLGLGRTTIYDLIGDGTLKTVKVGKRRLVTAKQLNEFVESLS